MNFPFGNRESRVPVEFVTSSAGTVSYAFFMNITLELEYVSSVDEDENEERMPVSPETGLTGIYKSMSSLIIQEL